MNVFCTRLLFLMALLLGLSGLQAHGETVAMATDPNYILSIGDTIVISVAGEADLATTQLIDKAGNCRLNLIGEINLAGKSAADAEREIEKAYIAQEMLKSPSVRISIAEYSLRQVSVMGAVKNPGKVAFTKDSNSMDIVDVIGRAGGPTNLARGDIVQVFRMQTDGKEIKFTVDYTAMSTGSGSKDKPREFLVLPGDKIVVPERIF